MRRFKSVFGKSGHEMWFGGQFQHCGNFVSADGNVQYIDAGEGASRSLGNILVFVVGDSTG